MSYTYGTNNSRQNTFDNRNWPAVIASNSSRTPTTVDVQRVDQLCDHVGAHLLGVARILTPIISINHIVINECRHSKSADDHRRDKSIQSDNQLPYYTPQRMKISETVSSSDDRSQCKCAVGDISGRKLTSDYSHNRSTNKSIYKPLSSEASGSTTLSISKKDMYHHNDSSKRFATSTEIQTIKRPQSKSNDFHSHYESKKCCICGIDIKLVKIMAQVPCKHSFCYPCMSRNELNACPKCRQPLKREHFTNITIQ